MRPETLLEEAQFFTMTISYQWLCEYLPVKPEPEQISKILTSIGLEVESLSLYEEAKGGLKGLVIGEVMECMPHPNADKLKITRVNVGADQPLQIICGASNVAAGQKVVVALSGTTIYPVNGEAMTLKKTKIRGEESEGMICAEDEIGLGESHDGIMVLDASAVPGTPAADFFKPMSDWIYEIGLTPNRMDAMSHLGVARDVCAYLSYHEKLNQPVRSPLGATLKAEENTLPFSIHIENEEACARYAGISIANVEVKESPSWLQQKLKSIGLRPINNIVDITNYVLHETGQPLHAFDADAIADKKIIVKTLPEGTGFIALDEKERKLSGNDLMICDSKGPLCMAGVMGGINSGVKKETRNIFLESAWFHPQFIRRSALKHQLRTDAAMRFEKGTDISNVVSVLKRAALLIQELAGGTIASEIVDIYPQPRHATEISVKYHYLKKLSGKNYHPENIRKILEALGFTWLKESIDEFRVSVPLSKTDVSLPADIVEEVMRIDGLDQVAIPENITIAPAHETIAMDAVYREKLSNVLVGMGFREIVTNSIVNGAWYDEETGASMVAMLNNLSAELNVMRPSMLESGLQCVAFNLNRKNSDLKLFELGKTYRTGGTGKYQEQEHLSIYITGNINESSWIAPARKSDLFYAKGIATTLLQQAGIVDGSWNANAVKGMAEAQIFNSKNQELVAVGKVSSASLKQFDIKQEVFFIDINWTKLLDIASGKTVRIEEIPRFPMVERDLSIVIQKQHSYAQVEEAIATAHIKKLKHVSLFDVFESEKLGADKKSLALHFKFADEEKTLTDEEVEKMMGKLMQTLEKSIQAEIRK